MEKMLRRKARQARQERAMYIGCFIGAVVFLYGFIPMFCQACIIGHRAFMK